MFTIIINFIRVFVRFAACGAIIGYSAAVWHSRSAIVESMRAIESGTAEHPRTESGRGSPGNAGEISRKARRDQLAEEDLAAKTAAFEEFRRKSAGFWEQEYAKALALAEERIAREAAESLAIARRVNAVAQREAERVARKTNSEHYRKAVRIAEEQAAANARAMARIAGSESSASRHWGRRQLDGNLTAKGHHPSP